MAKFDTEEDQAFLTSGTAIKLRRQLSENIKVQSTALVNAALDSTDPKVRGIATSLATFREILSQLQPPKDTTD